MARRKAPDEPLVLRSRRALYRWHEQALRGTTVVLRVTPKPVLVPDDATSERKPKVRTGRVEIVVRNLDLPAHSRVASPRYELLVRDPPQWHASPRFDLPSSHTFWFFDRPRWRLWREVGFDFRDFWFSADQVEVRTLPPLLEIVEPHFRLDSYAYTFLDDQHMPRPEEWIRWAQLGGVRLSRVDSSGFRVPPDAPPDATYYQRFREDPPGNLSDPLRFEVTWGLGHSFTLYCSAIHEDERAKALVTFLRARLEERKELRIVSGNCTFTVDEWRAKQAARPRRLEPVATVKGDDTLADVLEWPKRP